jgi:UDP-N-acetylglucosamine--N-acetylmuramyl-(pentapeptide) pyrophosphoryl-undecaprenol N-acetylglucosamine transferase
MAAQPSSEQRAPRARPRILIAGGGTGGHLFPGLAIAEAFRRLLPGTEVRFAGGAEGLEHRVVPAQGYRLYRIPVRGLYGVPWRRRLGVLATLPWAALRCLWILLSYRPQLVIGVGGYASGPMLAMALLAGRTCVIQEQNTSPGLTNRLLGRFVKRAFVVQDAETSAFRHPVAVGSPVRREILTLREHAARAAAVSSTSVPMLLVIGGSQGARAINEAMRAAAPPLKAWGRPLRILHQAGAQHAAAVRAGYAESGVEVETVEFIDDMAAAYAACRLIVSRAGASAVNEIVCARRASILIPIPGTSGDHQLKNARRLEQAGAARLIEQHALSGEALAREIIALLDRPDALDAMERACDRLFPGDSAERIVRECEALLK